MVSVIIPSRNDKFLTQTVQGLFEKAQAEVEVIAIIDGPTDYPLTFEHPLLKVIYSPVATGMRNSINLGVDASSGEYLMKSDSHCAYSEGYDTLLSAECDENWMVIARRNELDANWEFSDTTACDYWYLGSPWTSSQGFMRDCRWISRQQARMDIPLDETMTISGSMWFMSKTHFEQRIEHMNYELFGPWSGEPQELSCKTWLRGGKVMVNKRVTYGHIRPTHGVERGYHITWRHALRGLRAITQYVATDQLPNRIHNLEWWVDRFWPLPMEHTRVHGEKYYWEADWKEKYYHA